MQNNYICFDFDCSEIEQSGFQRRQCHKIHPNFILSKQQIDLQLQFIRKTMKIHDYEHIMEDLYKIIFNLQETQSFIDALHFIPDISEQTLEYQQQKFSKLKDHFSFRSIQNNNLFSLKNQQELINAICYQVRKSKEQIIMFEQYFNQIKYDYLQQISFLKFKQDDNKNNKINIESEPNNNYSKMEDKQDNNTSILNQQNKIDYEQKNGKQIPLKQKGHQLHQDEDGCIDIASSNIEESMDEEPKKSSDLKVVTAKENIQNQLQEKNESQNKKKMMRQKVQFKKQQIRQNDNSFQDEESNEELNSRDDSSYLEKSQQAHKRKIISKKLNTLDKQNEKKLDEKKKLKKQLVEKNQILIPLQQENILPTFTKRNLAISKSDSFNGDKDTSYSNNQEKIKKQNFNDENHLNVIKSPQMIINNADISSSQINQEKILEYDDESDEEIQVNKIQNDQIDKSQTIIFQWSVKNQIEQKQKIDSSNYQTSSSTPQNIKINLNQDIDGKNLIQAIEEESFSSTIQNGFNYYSQSKLIYYNQKGGLLLLNQKNIVLYTSLKPKVKKSRFDSPSSYDSDDELNENQDSKQTNSNNQNSKELYLKKTLFQNIKSAEIFEVFSSYYVLILLETNGSIVIVKSNNLQKWKPFYKSGESQTYSCSYMFNNSSILNVLSFNTSQIKLFQIDLNSSKSKPRQVASKFLSYSLVEGQFLSGCQGFWQIIRNNTKQVVVQNEIYFFIAQENKISLFKTDMNKMEQISQGEFEIFNQCKIFNLCGQVSLVILQDNQICIYNQQFKLTTKIQAHPEFGNIVDCFLPQDQSESDLNLIVVQQNCCFRYNCNKNSAHILKLPQYYNMAFYSQNQSQFISLLEKNSSTIQLDIIPSKL